MLIKRRVSLKTMFFILVGIGVYFHYVTYKIGKKSNSIHDNKSIEKNDNFEEKLGLSEDDLEEQRRSEVHRKEMEELGHDPRKMIEKRLQLKHHHKADKDENTPSVAGKKGLHDNSDNLVQREGDLVQGKAVNMKTGNGLEMSSMSPEAVKKGNMLNEKSNIEKDLQKTREIATSKEKYTDIKTEHGLETLKSLEIIEKNNKLDAKTNIDKDERKISEILPSSEETTDTKRGDGLETSPESSDKIEESLVKNTEKDVEGVINKNVEVTKEKQKSTKTSSAKGKVNVYSWNDICINIDNYNVYWNPLFPKIPHKGYFLERLQDSDWIRKTASRRFIGYLHIAESANYSFQMLSRDGMAVMLFDGDFRNDKKLLQFSMDKDEIMKQAKIIESDKERMFDLYTKTSKEIELKAGHKYPFDIVHSCSFFGRMELKIKKRGDTEFKTIDSSYISPYHDSTNVNVEMPDAFFFSKKSKLRDKFNLDKRLYFGDKVSLNGKTCMTGLKSCDYEPSYLFKGKKLKTYYGQQYVQRDLIYPDDNTKFPGKDLFERILEKKKAEKIAKEVFEAIKKTNDGKYKLKHIVHVEENNEQTNGKRYFVELDMEDLNDGKIYRFSDYFLKPSADQPLCLPRDYSNWRKDVTVYMVCAIKNQRPWVRYLINSIETVIDRTHDKHLHLILIDFSSTDVDVEEMIKSSRLNYTFIRMSGNFSKARALNEGVRRIPNNDSIVFVMDLQLQIPDHIFDQARKHTIQGKMTYCPILMRLQCGQHPEYTNITTSIWMDIGYGMMSLYKSDWLRIGGMNEEMFSYKWGGEDWEFVDRVMLGNLELVHQRLPDFYHIYHSTLGTWDGTKLM